MEDYISRTKSKAPTQRRHHFSGLAWGISRIPPHIIDFNVLYKSKKLTQSPRSCQFQARRSIEHDPVLAPGCHRHSNNSPPIAWSSSKNAQRRAGQIWQTVRWEGARVLQLYIGQKARWSHKYRRKGCWKFKYTRHFKMAIILDLGKQVSLEGKEFMGGIPLLLYKMYQPTTRIKYIW